MLVPYGIAATEKGLWHQKKEKVELQPEVTAGPHIVWQDPGPLQDNKRILPSTLLASS
jgi:hypothetical protein